MEFMFLCFFFGFKVEFCNLLEDYKGIQPPPRSIIFSLKNIFLQRFLGGVKGLSSS
jgi:hypothetical protein